MEKIKYILTAIITLCSLITYAQPAQYTPMTAAGYQMKRLKVDSTLHLPSFCGVPTLRGSSAKEGALAIDTCGGFLFIWTNENGWDTIGGSAGGGLSTDTTSLSNRINQRIDSIRRKGDSIFARKNGVFVFQYKDSIGGGGISGTGSQYYVPKFSATTTLQNSQIFDSVNVGINTTTPQYKLDVNGDGRINNIVFYNGIYGGNRIFGGNLMEYQTNDSLKQHLFTNEVGSDSLSFGTFGGANAYVMKVQAFKSGQIGQTGTAILRLSGDENNEKFTFLTNGDFINKNLATNGVDKMVTIDSLGKLKTQIIPSGGGDTSKVVIAQVHNATATTLLKGEVVYLFGSNGNVASVKRANNKDNSTSAKTIGIVRSNITSGSNGFITTQGQVDKLNLGAYAEGDVLYLDSIDGQLTKVKPQAPYHSVFIGIVERANNGNGLAYIKVQNGVELNEVHDVQINNILNNQIIVYSDTQKVWKNRNVLSIVDTTTLFATKSNVALKLNATDTASLSNRINLKLNISDTSTMLSKYLRKTDTASLSNRINEKLTNLDLLQSLSYGAKAEPYGVTLSTVTSQLALTSLRLNLYPFNWNVSDSVRGIAFLNRATTTLTQTNYNGVAIYSLSGGTLTRLTFTANNGTFWDGTSNTWKSQAITPFFLNKGVYYLGYQVSGSAGTPTIASGQIMQTGLIELPSALNPNGVKISSFISNSTTTPPSSIAMSTTTTLQQVPYFILY